MWHIKYNYYTSELLTANQQIRPLNLINYVTFIT